MRLVFFEDGLISSSSSSLSSSSRFLRFPPALLDLEDPLVDDLAFFAFGTLEGGPLGFFHHKRAFS